MKAEQEKLAVLTAVEKRFAAMKAEEERIVLKAGEERP